MNAEHAPRNGSRYIPWIAVTGILVAIIAFLSISGIKHVFDRFDRIELALKDHKVEIETLRREREVLLLAREREWTLMKERFDRMHERDVMQDKRLDAMEARRK